MSAAEGAPPENYSIEIDAATIPFSAAAAKPNI
jgi:hypothetical protein